MATWKELTAEGVKRCCAMYTNGKRCRARADRPSNWCKRHRGTFDAVKEWNKALLDAAKKEEAKEEEQESYTDE